MMSAARGRCRVVGLLLLLCVLQSTTPSAVALTSLETRLLQILSDNHQQTADQGDAPEKRNIWKVYDKKADSVLIAMQRTTKQKEQNGYWMLQYKCLDGCQPSDWTDVRDKFNRWGGSDLSLDLTTADGRTKKYDGRVRLEGLIPGHTYGLRTLYSLNEDGSGSVIEPATDYKKNGYEFETEQEAVDKKSLRLSNLEQRLQHLLDMQEQGSQPETRGGAHSEERDSLIEDTAQRKTSTSLRELLLRALQDS